MFHVIVQVFFFMIFLLIAFLSVLPWRSLLHIVDTGRNNEQALEGLRGLAALAVVACHVNQFLLSYLQIPGIPLTGNRIGGLGVQIFFSLTAYLFTKKALQGGINPTDFYKKRILRIVPLYIFLSLCTIVLSLNYMGTPVSIWDTLIRCINVLSFGFIGHNTDLYLPNYDLLVFQKYNAMELIGIAWSLSYEWRFYLVLPVLYFISLDSTNKRTAILIIVIILAVRDFYIYSTSKVVWPFFIGGSIAALIVHYFPNFSVNVRLSRFFSCLSLPLLIGSIFTPEVYNYKHFLLTSSLFISIVLGKPKLLQYKPLLALGQISYSIYLMQYLVLKLVNNAMYPNILYSALMIKFLVSFLMIGLLIPIASCTYKFIELPGMQGTFFKQFKFALKKVKKSYSMQRQ
ncbi:O-acetyltransferase OatA [Legionella parisiensis]|uniref:O-acetyltransferase OatA n=1 Tax=Legionella parisiensis TaxID=45071 RepID=A0A1E5JM48_9GAMM|nr:acyltransferase [Legionella parisiensis]OEH45627.1 O-acetyltransferase OatA [Legionella parisiensis]